MKLTSDFVFEGLNVLKKKPHLFLIWGIVYLLMNIGALFAMVSIAGPQFNELLAANASGATQSDPSKALELFSKLLPAYSAMILITIILGSVMQCAVYRSVISPGQEGFGYMKLGGDELRQIVVSIVLSLVFIGIYIGLAIVMGIGIGISTVALKDVANGLVNGLVIVVLVVGGILALLYIMSRLSLAGPISLDQKRIDVFGSWGLTKSNGWNLFGGYVLMIIITILMGIVFAIVFWGVMLAVDGGQFNLIASLQQPDMGSIQALLKPEFLVRTALGAIIGVPIYALTYGAPAAAYKILKG